MKKIQIEHDLDIKTNNSNSQKEDICKEDLTKINPNKFKTLKIINSLFFVSFIQLTQDSNNIDLFSTNELERIIIYTNFDRKKTLEMIEIKSKEDIFKLIEEADKLKPLTIINKSSDGDEVEKKYRSIYLIGYKNINLSLLDSEIAWNFLNKTQNIIPLYRRACK